MISFSQLEGKVQFAGFVCQDFRFIGDTLKLLATSPSLDGYHFQGTPPQTNPNGNPEKEEPRPPGFAGFALPSRPFPG